MVCLVHQVLQYLQKSHRAVTQDPKWEQTVEKCNEVAKQSLSLSEGNCCRKLICSCCMECWHFIGVTVISLSEVKYFMKLAIVSYMCAIPG